MLCARAHASPVISLIFPANGGTVSLFPSRFFFCQLCASFLGKQSGQIGLKRLGGAAASIRVYAFASRLHVHQTLIIPNRICVRYKSVEIAGHVLQFGPFSLFHPDGRATSGGRERRWGGGGEYFMYISLGSLDIHRTFSYLYSYLIRSMYP